MGFFKFLDLSSSPTPAVEHELSFHLTEPYTYSRQPILSSSLTSRPSQLPLEIVVNIMEAAYYMDDLEANTTFLRQCALVSKSWSIPAQKLLFRHVTLRSNNAYHVFQRAVNRTTTKGRSLGNSVVRLQVVIDYKQPFGMSQYSFAHAVTLCPNLYELDLAVYGCGAPGRDIVGVPDISRMQRPAPSFDENTLSLLKAGPRITSLRFNNCSENRHSIVQLLNIWPSLKCLVASGMPPQLSSTSTEPLGCALTQVRMNFQTTPSLDFMKWLLHNSSDSLRTLELEREPSLHFLDYLVQAHGETLHSLALPACGSHEHAQAVQKCSQLRELSLENPWASPMVYKKLPEDLQHLAIGLNKDTALNPAIAAIKSLRSLKAVTVQIWDGGSRHPQLPTLKIACAYRGIDLRITRDVRVFRAMVRGDPIPTSNFPRVKTLDNFRLMCADV